MSETSPAPTSLAALADWHLAEALRADDRGDELTRDFHIGAAELLGPPLALDGPQLIEHIDGLIEAGKASGKLHSDTRLVGPFGALSAGSGQ